jgi:Uma2 family endonuclease
MTTTKRELLTAEDLLRLHSQGVKGELIRGVLASTVSTGMEHGVIAMTMGASLVNFVTPGRLGRVFGTDTGVLLQYGPDIVREPDVAFISVEKLPLDVRIRGYTDVVPELVVEITSPNDTVAAIYDKAMMWLYYGVALVWVVDPDTRTIDVHPSGAPIFTLTEDDTLDGGTVLPGFTLPVSVVFE